MFHNQVEELEKKCSNMKLLLSQKMEELEYSRKSITSLEKSVAEQEVCLNNDYDNCNCAIRWFSLGVVCLHL